MTLSLGVIHGVAMQIVVVLDQFHPLLDLY